MEGSNLLHKCRNTENGYVPSPDTTGRNKGATWVWMAEFEWLMSGEVGSKLSPKRSRATVEFRCAEINENEAPF